MTRALSIALLLMTTPAWSAPARQPAVETILGRKLYRDGDVIHITDVLSTLPRLEQGDTVGMKGRVCLDSKPGAKLCLVLKRTIGDGGEESDTNQSATISRGVQDFERKATLELP